MPSGYLPAPSAPANFPAQSGSLLGRKGSTSENGGTSWLKHIREVGAGDGQPFFFCPFPDEVTEVVRPDSSDTEDSYQTFGYDPVSHYWHKGPGDWSLIGNSAENICVICHGRKILQWSIGSVATEQIWNAGG